MDETNQVDTKSSLKAPGFKMKNMFSGRITGEQFLFGWLIRAGAMVVLCIALLSIILNGLAFLFIFLIPLYLLILIFGFSLLIRRLHDLGFSGWWSLILLLPLINFVFFAYLLLGDADVSENKYGKRFSDANLFDVLLGKINGYSGNTIRPEVKEEQ